MMVVLVGFVYWCDGSITLVVLEISWFWYCYFGRTGLVVAYCFVWLWFSVAVGIIYFGSGLDCVLVVCC